MDLKAAYADLKNDETAIKKYLISKGILGNQIIFSSVNIDKQFNTKTNENGNQVG